MSGNHVERMQVERWAKNRFPESRRTRRRGRPRLLRECVPGRLERGADTLREDRGGWRLHCKLDEGKENENKNTNRRGSASQVTPPLKV